MIKTALGMAALGAAGGGRQNIASGVGRGDTGEHDSSLLILQDGTGPNGEGKKLLYGRYDLGRANTADMVYQFLMWRNRDKVMLPDYLELELATGLYRVETEEIQKKNFVDVMKEEQGGGFDDVQVASSGSKLDVELKLLHDSLAKKGAAEKKREV